MESHGQRARRLVRSAGIAASLVVLVVSAACRTTTDGDGGRSPTPKAAGVKVFLQSGNTAKCDEVVAATRTVEEKPTLLVAMRALAKGPTAGEKGRGLAGWFTEATADVVKSAEIEDGVATVDFQDLRQLIPGASSSCGSSTLLAQLDRTARQFPAVKSTLYSINGSTADFYGWLQQTVPSPTPAAAQVKVYLHTSNDARCDEVVPVTRTVEGPPTLLAAMRALVKGPTAEERGRGLAGWFTQATADVVQGAQIRGGVATVEFKDLRPLIPNASSSCGSSLLLAQLDGTARQFPGVTSTLYSINGSTTDFYEWLQMPVPGS